MTMDDAERRALLACPFCDGEAALTGTNMYRAGQQKKVAVCRDCGACAAEDLWNRRDTPPAVSEGFEYECGRLSMIDDAVRMCIGMINIIGALPGSSIHSALSAAAEGIRALAPQPREEEA